MDDHVDVDVDVDVDHVDDQAQGLWMTLNLTAACDHPAQVLLIENGSNNTLQHGTENKLDGCHRCQTLEHYILSSLPHGISS